RYRPMGCARILGGTGGACHSPVMAERESSPDGAHIFDRRAVRLHRDRASFRFPKHDFLFREVAARLVERLGDINRTFALAIELGAHGRLLRDALAGTGKVGWLAATDLSRAMAAPSEPAIVADEQFLPFAPASADLVLSNLSLHWINDLPGALVQIRRALKPDGLFLAAMLGGDTLCELRAALIEAESATSGGA